MSCELHRQKFFEIVSARGSISADELERVKRVLAGDGDLAVAAVKGGLEGGGHVILAASRSIESMDRHVSHRHLAASFSAITEQAKACSAASTPISLS